MTFHPLPMALEAAIPFWVLELQKRSDIWEYIQRKAPEASHALASRADNLLFRSKKKGETAELFNTLAEAIAFLSFLPGGVTVFGVKHDYEHPELPKSSLVPSELDQLKLNLEAWASVNIGKKQ